MKHPFLDLGKVNARYRDVIDAAVKRVLDSGCYVGGAEVERFEKSLADYVGVKHAVAVSNGLDALRLILRAYIEMGKLTPGDEVIVPANTYIATILAISDNGLKPVLVEPSAATLNLDSSLIARAITERTRAIMPVHLYGRVCRDETLAEMADRFLIIEDNAQAIGAQYQGIKTGALGHAAAFSFYPTKNLGALGDAGAVTTDDQQLADCLQALRNYGSDRQYHNIYQGLNCRMDPMQAAILDAKLKNIDNENADRQQKASVYDQLIDNQHIVKPEIPDDTSQHVWHQYVVRCDSRDRLREYLAENGVGTAIHYATPPHRQPCYQGKLGETFPITDHIADTVLSLPIAADTGIDDIKDICSIINRFR